MALDNLPEGLGFHVAASGYDELQAALRDRAEQLGTTRLAIDEVAGLPMRYAGKVLAPEQVKTLLGAKTLGPILQALGLRLVVEHDPEAFARHGARAAGGRQTRVSPTREAQDQRSRATRARAKRAAAGRLLPGNYIVS
jgi:hypothetical protein